MSTFSVNGEVINTDADPEMPLLWFLREQRLLTGTKFGCGIAQCGACTVHIDGTPARSCSVTIGSLRNVNVTTIEGLQSDAASAVHDAWVASDVVQCGYCQSGQIMSAVGLLESNTAPSDAEIDQAMAGNICRCGTYHRIRQAIHLASKRLRARSSV